MNHLDTARAIQRKLDALTRAEAKVIAGIHGRYEAKRDALMQGVPRAVLAILEASALADETPPEDSDSDAEERSHDPAIVAGIDTRTSFGVPEPAADAIPEALKSEYVPKRYTPRSSQ